MEQMEQFVEATITSFQFDRAEREIRIEVTCAWEENERKRITMRGVNGFVIDDMRLYNIIDRITLFDSEGLERDHLGCASRLFYLLQKRDMDPSDLEWPTLNEKLSLIRSGVLRLVEIEPVCGASIVALIEGMQIDSIPK